MKTSLWLYSPILIISLLLPRQTKAQVDSQKMDLKMVLEHGLKNSLVIKQAEKDQEKARYQVKEVQASAIPQINAEGQFQNFPNLPTQLLPGEIIGEPGTQIPVQFGTTYNSTGTISASQVIYNQELFSGLKAARDSRELYKLLRIKSEEDLIYQIAGAYYQALELQSQIGVLDSNLASLDKLIHLMQARYENDLITRNDLDRVQVQKTNLSTQLQSLNTGWTQQLNYLKLLMGMPIQTSLELLEPQNLEETSLEAISLSGETPVELQILQKQKDLSLRNKEVSKAGYFPSLALFGQQSWQAQRNEFNFFESGQPWFQQTVIGLQLQVPIFDGGQKHALIQQNKLEIDKISLQQTNAQRQLDLQTENAREQLQNSLNSVRTQEKNKELARKVYYQSQQLYQEEIIGLSDLLDAEQAYRAAQTNYYNELLKYKRSELDLLKALGRINQILN